MDSGDYKKEFEGKKILVTGGAGSIGREIVKQLLTLNPAVVRVFDSNETGLFDLEHELGEYSSKVTFLVGDVRDKDRMMRATSGINIVFHAAALKHVHLCEYNPFEAIKTNVLGTQNIIDACLNNEIEKMIFISTDKAVNPTNVMGASKLLAERLTIAAKEYKGTHRTIFSCVRFGNVLASQGSVVPLFINQIKKGGPVTITDANMTRFIMSISSSVKLILKASCLAKGGEIFILKMPAIKIGDLASAMIKEYAPRLGQSASAIKTKIIGKRPGEKMDEELFTAPEGARAKMLSDELIAVYPETSFDGKNAINKTMVSNGIVPLKENEIIEILKGAKLGL